MPSVIVLHIDIPWKTLRNTAVLACRLHLEPFCDRLQLSAGLSCLTGTGLLHPDDTGQLKLLLTGPCPALVSLGFSPGVEISWKPWWASDVHGSWHEAWRAWLLGGPVYHLCSAFFFTSFFTQTMICKSRLVDRNSKPIKSWSLVVGHQHFKKLTLMNLLVEKWLN